MEGKDMKQLIALFVSAVLCAAGQAIRLNVASGSSLSVHFFQGMASCSCISHSGAFLWGRSTWLCASFCSSAVHAELTFHDRTL